eukprot:scpid83610/ scgid27021/ 
MSLCRRVLQQCLQQPLLRHAASPVFVRYNQSLPNRMDRHFIDEEELFRRMYAREFLTTADMNPTERPRVRRFGIVMCQSGYISEKNNLAMKTVLKRLGKAEGFIDYLKMEIQVTKKPPGKRMGGGKGKKAYKVSFVQPNKMIYEWDCDDRIAAEKYARRLRYLTPLRLKLVMNDLPPLETLQEKVRMNVPVKLEEFKGVVKELAKNKDKKNLKPTGPFDLKIRGQF